MESSLHRISSIFFVVETKRFVSSTVNVILMRQTCGQRSSRAAESKRRALGNYFSERICYMLLISKYRETEIKVRAQLRYLRLGNRSAMAKSGKKTCFDVGKIRFFEKSENRISGKLSRKNQYHKNGSTLFSYTMRFSAQSVYHARELYHFFCFLSFSGHLRRPGIGG